MFIKLCSIAKTDDPEERRRSLSTSGEDTDMRQAFMEERQSDLNLDILKHQADEQYKNGIISFPLYNKMLQQVSVNQEQMEEKGNKMNTFLCIYISKFLL